MIMAAATAIPDAIIRPPPAAARSARLPILYPDSLSEVMADADTMADADSNPAAILAQLRAAAGITLPWPQALLRAVGQWTLPAETVGGQRWQYVIGGEALDWLTLAHRLSTAIPDAIPPSELESLLFYGRLPGAVDPETFRRLIGTYRYTAHLNFQYGVVVEEALQLAVEESVRKNYLAQCYGDSAVIVAETYRHLYGATEDNLYREFSADAGPDALWQCPDDTDNDDDTETMSLAGWREFTYWLFKRRIRKWHPARVASDTRRGLDKLRELRGGDAGSQDAGNQIDAGIMPAPEWSARSQSRPAVLAGGVRKR